MSPSLDELDPQIRALLEQLAQTELPVGLEAIRANHEATSGALGGPPVEVAHVEGADADGVPVRIYKPSDDLHGTVVYAHGGGWAVGSLDSYDRLCRRLALATGARVVSVGYRLAPEHPFPAPLDDVRTAVGWTAGAFAGPLAVAGDSAGANLVTVAARRARDQGGPAIAFQALAFPPTDARRDTPSSRELAEGFFLTAEAMDWYAEQYVPDGTDPLDPDVSPLRAGDLSGLPPALVMVASHDLLRDEGIAYAERMREAGVPVEVVVLEGMVHGVLRWTGRIDAAAGAIERLGAAIRDGLAAG